jgi:hypothetical protein
MSPTLHVTLTFSPSLLALALYLSALCCSLHLVFMRHLSLPRRLRSTSQLYAVPWLLCSHTICPYLGACALPLSFMLFLGPWCSRTICPYLFGTCALPFSFTLLLALGVHAPFVLTSLALAPYLSSLRRPYAFGVHAPFAPSLLAFTVPCTLPSSFMLSYILGICVLFVLSLLAFIVALTSFQIYAVVHTWYSCAICS